MSLIWLVYLLDSLSIVYIKALFYRDGSSGKYEFHQIVEKKQFFLKK